MTHSLHSFCKLVHAVIYICVHCLLLGGSLDFMEFEKLAKKLLPKKDVHTSAFLRIFECMRVLARLCTSECLCIYFVLILRSCGVQWHNIRSYFDELDVDGSGCVDQLEFLQVFNSSAGVINFLTTEPKPANQLNS